MNSNISYYTVTFQDPEIKTLGQWLRNPSAPVYPSRTTVVSDGDWSKYVEEFLGYKNIEGVTNEEILKSTLKRDELDSLKQITKFDYPMSIGMSYVIPIEKVNTAGLQLEGLQLVTNDEPAFKVKQLAKIEDDLGYIDIKKSLRGTQSIIKETYPDLTVWIWCRSLTDKGEKELSGRIFNLTPFISSCTSGSTKTGGNFSITLAPIECERDEKGKWSIKKSTYKVNQENQIEYISQANLTSLGENGEPQRSRFLFHDMIGTNDLIFLRYETLKMEEDTRSEDLKNIFIDKSNLPKKIYDMIGLIDRNTQSINPQTNEVSIVINGRDLSKLMIEDGTYFYALENKEGKPKFMGESSMKSDLGQRILGSLTFLNAYFFHSIKDVLQFIVTQLSSIKIVPDSLFEGYDYEIKDQNNQILETSKRNRTFKTSKKTKQEREKFVEEQNIRRETAKKAIRNLRASEKISVKEKLSEDSSIEYIYDNIESFLRSGMQSTKDQKGEYVSSITESSTSITGWSSFIWSTQEVGSNEIPNKISSLILTSQEDTWNNNSIKTLFNQVYQILKLQDEQDKKSDGNKLDYELLPGIWQIIKLVVDKSVTGRRIVDSSMTTASGSLLNFVRKICQEPFVEFYMDTYGDKFYFIVRRPPTDKIGYTSLLNGNVSTESGNYKIKQGSSVVDIYSHDVLQENLSIDDQQAYSWYHLTPENALVGNASSFTTNYIPALVFPKYAEIWGSRSLDIRHNYLPYLGSKEKEDNNLSFYELQAYEDMSYLVSSNQYLPFSRRGTITINRDRRIKIGNLVRYKLTGEIFMVDGIQHTHSISRNQLDATTTLTVSRGLVERFVKGEDIEFSNGGAAVIKNVSYFNIINTELNKVTKRTPATRKVKKEVSEPKLSVEQYREVVKDTTVGSVVGKNPFGVQQGGQVSQVATTWSSNLELLIKKEERFKAKPYLDVNGYAIGYGNHQYENGTYVKSSDPSITEERAVKIMRVKLSSVIKDIRNSFPKINFLQNELDALISLFYNTGSVGDEFKNAMKEYKRSPTSGSYNLTRVWLRYCNVTDKKTNVKKPDTNLKIRRTTEVSLFLNTNYTSILAQNVIENERVYEEIEEIIPNKFIDSIDSSKVFSNFKVDEDIFNFFLSKKQFDSKYI